MLKNKVSDFIYNIISQTPFLELFLSNNILNISALSKNVKIYLKREYNFDVTESSILMAFKRYNEPFDHRRKDTIFFMSEVNQISVNSNLKYFRFKKDSTFIHFTNKFIDFRKKTNSKSFIFETTDWFTMVIEEKYKSHFLELIPDKPNEVKDELAAVSIYFSVEDVRYPGLYYMIFKQLAWNNINVFEVSSSGNEITLIIENSNVKDLIDLIQQKKIELF